MKILTLIAFSILSLNIFAHDSVPAEIQAKMNVDLKVRLLICTQKAPMLCPMFNLTHRKAKKKIREICGTQSKKVRLKAKYNIVNGKENSYGC